MKRRQIAIVTGTRAEYGILRRLIDAAERHPKLRPQVIVTGMHLLRRFGRTLDQVRVEQARIAAVVPMQRGRDDVLDQAEGLARGVSGIAKAIDRLGVQIVVVLGDRLEALAGALAGVMTRRFVAHIHGGDVAAAEVDDSVRHAITKLAHVHLVASRQAARRVRRLGERPDAIHLVGALGLDEVFDAVGNRSVRRNGNGVPSEPFALVLQHPIGAGTQPEYRWMRQTLQAVSVCGLAGLIIYPCSDPGYTGIVRAIEKPPIGRWLRVCSLPRREYLDVLQRCTVIVGNSSSGIIEAGAAGTPAVDVGPRQAGRQPNGPAVIHCPYGREAVQQAIKEALRRRPRAGQVGVYGDGHAAERIVRVLATMPLKAGCRVKQICY